MKKVRKVVIPAAGLGTRGLPFTKEVPKELIPLIDTPALHFIVEEAVQAGIEQVIFITSKGKSALEDYFDPSPALERWLRDHGKAELADKIHRIGTMVDVLSVRQKEPRGLGHAVLCAKELVGDEPFAVCLGDELFFQFGKKGDRSLKVLADTASKLSASVIGILAVPKPEVVHYGIVDIEGDPLKSACKIKRTVEKPKPEKAPSQYAIIGRYVFQPELMEALENVQPGAGGEIQLTDAMDKLAASGKLYGMVLDEKRYDVGNPLYYVLAQVDLALRRPELAERLKPELTKLLENR